MRRERKGKLLKGETDRTGESAVEEYSKVRGEQCSRVQRESRAAQREKEAGLPGEFYRHRLKREQVRKSRRLNKPENENLEQIARVSLRPSRAIQRLREKPD